MDNTFHPLRDLFKQIGLGSSPKEIDAFLRAHAPLAEEIALPDAPFWSPTQAAFLRESLATDSDWAGMTDVLSAALRQVQDENSAH